MKNTAGLPMNEEDLKEWRQIFIDIEDSIKKLYSEDDKKRKTGKEKKKTSKKN